MLPDTFERIVNSLIAELEASPTDEKRRLLAHCYIQMARPKEAFSVLSEIQEIKAEDKAQFVLCGCLLADLSAYDNLDDRQFIMKQLDQFNLSHELHYIFVDTIQKALEEHRSVRHSYQKFQAFQHVLQPEEAWRRLLRAKRASIHKPPPPAVSDQEPATERQLEYIESLLHINGVQLGDFYHKTDLSKLTKLDARKLIDALKDNF